MTHGQPDVHELLELVADRESFLRFVKALERDFVERRAEWQNITIDAFLESAAAWARDSRQVPETPSWRVLAEFLYVGKIYE